MKKHGNDTELAKAYNVTPRTVARWRKAGVNVTDSKAVAVHREASQPNGRTSTSTAATPPKPDKGAPDYFAARARWKHWQAERAKLDAQKAAKEVIPADTIVADIQRVSAITRANFLSLADVLPPSLEGVDARQAGKILREAVAGVLERMQRDFAALTP